MCKVVHCKKERYDVYIGRPSKWGNPFTHIRGRNTLARHVVASREESIAKYREWIEERIASSDGERVIKALRELKGKTLGCWCSPQACHGDILAELVQKHCK